MELPKMWIVIIGEVEDVFVFLVPMPIPFIPKKQNLRIVTNWP